MKPYTNGTAPAAKKGGSAKKKKAAAAGSKVQKTIAKASVSDLRFARKHCPRRSIFSCMLQS